MKKKFKYLIIITFVLLFPMSIKAINIDNVDIDVYLDKNGNANVKEVWTNPKANYNDTEFYKAYDNLGKMKITNFNVSYNNQVFTYEEDWNIDKSFNEKAYRNGLYYEGSKTELCFGITDFESGTYELTYTITNFIVKLNDSDMVYFNFIPDGNNINNFHLKMYSDFNYDNKLPVWGFGKKNGTAYVYDGYIEMNSEGSIDNNEYFVLLAQFDNDTFNSEYKIDKDFEYYLNMAKNGSKASINSNPVVKTIKSVLSFLLANIWFIIVFTIGFFVVKASKNKVGSYKYDFGENKRKLPKEVNKIREIPFDDIYKVYLYTTVYYLNSKKTDLLGAVLLKWLKDKKITIEKGQSKILKKEECKIILNKSINLENNFETDLYNMMYEASGDGILESKEFERWCKKNYDEILKWFDDVLDDETKKLIKENILISNEGYKKVTVTDKFFEEAKLVKGVKDFLIEFSRIDEKEAIEVHLWELYLIYAQIFGIADRVAKQFKKIYPNEIEEYNKKYGYGIDDIIFINMISTSGVSSAISSRNKANSYSSGGGGFMSSAGGGGSFGSGGSMGSR